MEDTDADGGAVVHTTAPRYRLPEATRMILGDFEDHGLADPERWVAKQLRLGRFRGQKIGRSWFMRAVDIQAAEAALTPQPPTPKPVEPIETSTIPAHPDLLAGASARSRRRTRGRR